MIQKCQLINLKNEWWFQFGSVMNQLYEGDEGLHSPNLKNEYQLKVRNRYLDFVSININCLIFQW